MIRITPSIGIDENEIEEHFIRAPGPGGQKVNKTESAVQLRFDARKSPNIPTDIYSRLKKLAGRRMTANGVVILMARRFRTQEANRRDAIDRLIGLIRTAAVPPKYRRPTKPSKAAKQRRLDGKRRQGNIKKKRGKGGLFD